MSLGNEVLQLDRITKGSDVEVVVPAPQGGSRRPDEVAPSWRLQTTASGRPVAGPIHRLHLVREPASDTLWSSGWYHEVVVGQLAQAGELHDLAQASIAVTSTWIRQQGPDVDLLLEPS